MPHPQSSCVSLLCRLSLLSISICAGMSSPPACVAQTSTSNAATTFAMLPDSPGNSFAPESVVVNTASRGSANISGVVVDQSGAAIENAHVSLIGSDGKSTRSSHSGVHGEFSFDNLPSGSFRVMVKAPGFATFASEPIVLTDKEAYVLPNASLSVATASTEIEVTADDTAVAEQQIKAAEKQRVLGFVPNFYTSFEPNAVALTPKQKYSLALRETFDPVRFVGTAIGASIQQANNNFPGYGGDAAGFGKRYAALYGDGLFSDILSHAVFPTLFHQDPRYFYQGTGTVKSRAMHALSFAIVTRSDKGRTVPNYSYLLGDLGAGALSNLYYPHADRGVGLVFTNTAIGIAGRAGASLAREFILPRITTHRADKVTP